MTLRAVVGRDRELTLINDALADGRVPAVWGPPGIGRSAVVAAALARRAAVTGHALATLAFRPALLFETALRARAPSGDPVAVATWVEQAVRARTLVCEDLHLAHPATLDVLALLAPRMSLVLTIATGHPRTAAVRAALAGWGDQAVRAVELGPLPADSATEVVRAANPALDAETSERIATRAGGIPAWLIAEARNAGEATARGVVDGFDPAGRTALAAAALLARPAPAAFLGPGAGDLVARGAAVRLDNGEIQVVGPLARAALARVPQPDRARLHGFLADRLTGAPGERARHLAAATRTDEAVAAAQEAADVAASTQERAAHLHFAARTAPSPPRVAAAVAALLDAGDLAAARHWVDDLDRRDAGSCLLAGRVLRYAGEATQAVGAVRRGLTAAEPGSDVWRGLLVELLWLEAGGPSGTPLGPILAACAGTAEEASARVAAQVVTAVSDGDVAALRACDLTQLLAPESLHVGMQVVRSLLRLGDGAAAREVAARVARAATDAGYGSWADVARVEGAWSAYLLAGDERTLTDVGEVLQGLLAESVRDRAQALLELGLVDRNVTDRRIPAGATALRSAIAAEASLAADELDEVLAPAASAGLPSGDPITALLAGPAWITAASRLGLPVGDLAAYPLLAAEAAALDRPDPVRLTAVASRWRDVAVRGAARCLLAAGTPETRAEAAAVAEGAGLARWAARAGARPGEGAGPLTPRERQVLELVGAGCTTPMIARRLGLAASTVESHVKSAKLKLGATTRADAVARLS